MLSEPEQQTLRELEHELAAEDPKLAAFLVEGPTTPATRRNRGYALATVVVLVATIAAMFSGFVVAAGAGVFALAAIGRIYHGSQSSGGERAQRADPYTLSR